MRLASAFLAGVPGDVARPDYDRDAQQVGIVHFGIGAFHRAHQAWYTDAALSFGDRDWAITGVSLRSPVVASRMNPQDGLFTLAENSAAQMRLRIVGAVRNVLVAADSAAAIVHVVAAPATRIVSFTVTEKGYCRAAHGGLDWDLAGMPGIYSFLLEGLRARRANGLPGVTLLSCDNLADNGRLLEQLLGEYLERHEPGMLAWFGQECACPATMVDRIVPATTDTDSRNVQRRLAGLRDEACVTTEPFAQWVMEDRFAGPRPRWSAVGAELVSDVRPYETAKLRMLNGAHSALAYLGLVRGLRCVHEAIGDPVIHDIVGRLLRTEAQPTIVSAPGQDLDAYRVALLERFANPALQHGLLQIAMDGSQKIPQRWLPTLAANAAAGRSCPAILTALGAWLAHLRGDNGPVDDPLAATLTGLWKNHDASGVAAALFGPRGLFADHWVATDGDLAFIRESAASRQPGKAGHGS
jgi:fructuronate reductase